MFEVVDYSEEKTIEKLQQFVNNVVSGPSVPVCVSVQAAILALFSAMEITFSPFNEQQQYFCRISSTNIHLTALHICVI